jgi:hypothetical protein
MEINAAAPVITRDEILIHAPITTVCDIQTDIEAWPSWQPGVHVWTLTERYDGVLVHTEDSWEGERPKPRPRKPPRRPLRGWLENLKRAAEKS